MKKAMLASLMMTLVSATASAQFVPIFEAAIHAEVTGIDCEFEAGEEQSGDPDGPVEILHDSIMMSVHLQGDFIDTVLVDDVEQKKINTRKGTLSRRYVAKTAEKLQAAKTACEKMRAKYVKNGLRYTAYVDEYSTFDSLQAEKK